MPITQSRMIALIHAARDYQQALRAATKHITGAIIAARRSPATALDELETLGFLIQETGLLKQPLTSHSTIEREDSHFTKSRRGNDRNAARMTAVRSGIIQPKATPAKRRSRSQQHAAISHASLPFQSTTAPSSLAAQQPLPGHSIDELTSAPAQRQQPPTIGPLDAPGLYDPPDDPFDAPLGLQSPDDSSADSGDDDPFAGLSPEEKQRIEEIVDMTARGEDWMDNNQELLRRAGYPTATDRQPPASSAAEEEGKGKE